MDFACDEHYTHSALVVITILKSLSLVSEDNTQHSFLHASFCGEPLPMTNFKIRAFPLVYVFIHRHNLTRECEKHHAGAEVVQC